MAERRDRVDGAPVTGAKHQTEAPPYVSRLTGGKVWRIPAAGAYGYALLALLVAIFLPDWKTLLFKSM